MILSPHKAGSIKGGLWEIGSKIIDDLEAISMNLPPRRLQRAEFELNERHGQKK